MAWSKRIFFWAAAEMSQTVFLRISDSCIKRFRGLCDSVWIVDAPKDVRIARVMKRNAMTEEQVTARMMSQESETELLADRNPEVITNAGITSLLTKIENLLNLDIKKIEIWLREILAITGKPGLFRIVSQGNRMIVVEDLASKSVFRHTHATKWCRLATSPCTLRPTTNLLGEILDLVYAS